MHKVLWDAVIKCRKTLSSKERSIKGWQAYCAGCPLGSECGELDESEELRKGGEK